MSSVFPNPPEQDSFNAPGVTVPTPSPEQSPTNNPPLQTPLPLPTPSPLPTCGLCNGPMVLTREENVSPPTDRYICPRCATTLSNPLGARYQEPQHRAPTASEIAAAEAVLAWAGRMNRTDEYGDEVLQK